MVLYHWPEKRNWACLAGPYYVLDKDLKKNILIVTKNEKDLLKKELLVKNVNWISGKDTEIAFENKSQNPLSPRSRFWLKYTKHEIPRIQKPTIRKVPTCHHSRPVSGFLFKDQELLGGGIIC